jgi:hypothetical protein
MNRPLPDHVFAPGEQVLSRNGRPVAGYTLTGDAGYDRSRIHSAPWRLKEWDFYQISDGTLCLQLVIGHVSYAGNSNIAFFNQRTGERIFEQGVTIPLPFRSMRMPQSAHADSLLLFEHGGSALSFHAENGVRHLSAKSGGFSAEVTLTPSVAQSVSVCTPFDKPHEFYYNEKINLLKAECTVSLAGKRYDFDPSRTFSLLDWGRGVWPFSHEWYWSSVSTLLLGEPFGFNLGCGFGSTERARGTENVLYYRDDAIKLGRVDVRHENDCMQPWHLDEEDGRFSAVLTPQYDRDTVTKLLFVDNRCHQMFGEFSGNFTAPNGERILFDHISGFAEHAVNHW